MKHRTMFTIIFSCLFAACFSSYANGQDSMKQQNIMLLVDGSSYSNHPWKGKPRIKTLRTELGEAMFEVNKTPSWGYHMGIRIFGDKSERSKNDCMDTRVGAKLDWFEPNLISNILEGVKPKGRSCFTNAVAETKKEFDAAKKGSDNYLVCIISGIDECAREEGVTMNWITGAANLKASYVIGMNVSREYAQLFQEIYKKVPGKFINVKNPPELSDTLVLVLNKYCRGITEETEAEKSDKTNTVSNQSQSQQTEKKKN